MKYYSFNHKKLYLPKKLFKRVNAFINLAHFYTKPDGYYLTFTTPSIETLKNSADHNVLELIVGRETLFILFEKPYLPSETRYISWSLIHYSSITYKLRLWDKNKKELKFITEDPPPWLT